MHLFQLPHRAVARLARPALFWLLLLAGAASLTGHAQAPMPLVYRLAGPTLLQEANATGTPLSPAVFKSAPGGAVFSIINPVVTANGYLIQFAYWQTPAGFATDTRISTPTGPGVLPAAATFSNANGTPKSVTLAERTAFYESYYFDFNYDAFSGLERYFLITAEQLALSAAPVPPLLSPIGGTLVIPFKFRPQDGGDFTKDVTLSSMGGVALNFKRVSDLSLAGLLGIGLTSVTLTKENSKVPETQDRAAITFSLALLLQWQRLQFGVVGGWDVLGAGNADWIYNKKPWVGGGIGINIFRPDDVSAKKATTNTGTGTSHP